MHPSKLVLALLLPLLACRSSQPPPAPSAADSSPQEQALRIAREYSRWGALDTGLRMAPTDCRMPPVIGSGSMTISFADSGPHARKLYRLYARDVAAYKNLSSGAAPQAQVLVKEAFAAEPFEHPADGTLPPDSVWTAEGSFKAGAPAGLFLMWRTAGAAADESAWTYATVAAQGEITALGRIASCIGCHEAAPYAGLFGLERQR